MSYLTRAENGREITFETVEDYIAFHVPYEWRDSICTCVAPLPNYESYKADPDSLTRTCRSCGKFERWQLIKSCKGCGEHFFMRYWHPAINYKNEQGHSCTQGAYQRVCFDCVVKEFGHQEGEIPPAAQAKELRPINEILSEDLDFEMDFNV